MPSKTIERLTERVDGFRKRLAEAGDSMDAGRRRELRKRLRRAQRRRTLLVKAQPEAPAAEAPAAEGGEAGAES